jgi:hypothetical protein
LVPFEFCGRIFGQLPTLGRYFPHKTVPKNLFLYKKNCWPLLDPFLEAAQNRASFDTLCGQIQRIFFFFGGQKLKPISNFLKNKLLLEFQGRTKII